jgi:manganese/zinc/iron transport system substrate-binding protein
MKISTILGFIIGATVLCLCILLVMPQSHYKKKDILYIVCTTGIIADAVRHIAGLYAQVDALMGPGIDPHLYRARESDMHKLADADIIFYHGLHLEGKMVHMLDTMEGQKKCIAITDVLERTRLRSCHDSGMFDPHVWHDVRLWMAVITGIKNSLIQADQNHKSSYTNNYDCYVKELEKLHHYIQNTANRLSDNQRILITAHDAFAYFGASYGFKVIGLAGINTDSEVSTHEFQQLVKFIIAHQVKALFIETSITPRTMEAVQAAVVAGGGTVTLGKELYSDALGDHASGADTYIDMMTHNINAMVNGLAGN